MERKRRTHKHKGKIRFKRRLPRKQKKAQKKKWAKMWSNYKDQLIRIHGDDWYKHVILGG